MERIFNPTLPRSSLDNKKLRDELRDLKKKWSTKTHGKKCYHCRKFNYGANREDEYEDMSIVHDMQSEINKLKIEGERERKYYKNRLKRSADGAEKEYSTKKIKKDRQRDTE